jgi:hypothetical protein
MANTPSVSITISKNNLLRNIPAIDGIAAFIGTGSTVGNLDKIFKVNSLEDAVDQGITLAAEPAAYKVLREFYQELGGNQEVILMLVANTVTMTAMLLHTDPTMAEKVITAGEGRISHLGVFRNPPVGYDPGEDFFDADVATAVAAAQSFVEAQNAKLRFLRVLIEGRIAVEASTTIYAPNTASAGGVGVVLGDTVSGKGAAIGLALGRRMKYAAHIKLGKVANGPITATAIYIGTKTLANVTNLDTLHGKGVISFVTYPGKAGFYFGIDNMATNDDFRILVHGSVIDAAAKVAASVYIDELESEVDAEADGSIKELNAKYLEDRMRQQALVTLGERISDIDILVDRSVNIVTTSKTKIKIRVLPKGYNTWIEVDLGLTASI